MKREQTHSHSVIERGPVCELKFKNVSRSSHFLVVRRLLLSTTREKLMLDVNQI